jgi:protease-4
MKDFLKFMFASMVGFILTSIIIIFLFFSFIMAMVSLTKTEEVVVDNKSVLQLKLDYDIPDRTPNNPLNISAMGDLKPIVGLNDILKSIKNAKDDSRILGIYLDMFSVPSGFATITEIREALEDFKKSGKFIFAYGNIFDQKAFYLATIADKIYANQEGMIDFHGLSVETSFIKGLLDKLDIDVQIIRHGKFKSAVEPLMLDKMSDPSREQTQAFVSSIWDDVIELISQSRNISTGRLNEIADGLLAQTTEDAYNFGMVDSVIYKDQFLDILAKKIDVSTVRVNNLISVNKYKNAKVKTGKKRSKNKIAVVFASGDIVQGDGNDGISSGRFARTIRNARLDNSIKAIVLRVNSPGGDGLASDIILREVKLATKVKPVIVSMGNVAASGGYYISCGADYIIAEPTTITGSIGVFGLIPNMEKFFNDKLGVTFDGVKTNSNSDYMTITKPLTPYQRNIIQTMVDRFYTTFITHVSEGRGLTVAQVDSIGQGRVWSGTDALQLGLVDELGSLETAVNKAKELAELEDYRISELPKLKDPWMQLMEDFMGQTRQSMIKNELGEFYKYYGYMKTVTKMEGVQARMPFFIEIN